MNVNRLLGIFIASTLLIWILIFALSPQPKYQKINNIKIPELEEPSVNIQEFNKIEFEEVKKNTLKLDIKDDLPSAKDRVAKIDFNLYVYKVGAFGSSEKISNIVKSYNDAGFPAFTQENKSKTALTNVLVGPFATQKDIQDNQTKLNKIPGLEEGEVLAWKP